jgi:hypothetical protein
MDAHTADIAQYVMDESDARGIESNAYRPCNFGAITSADHECDDECITKERLAETATILEALSGYIGRGVWNASHFARATDEVCDGCANPALITYQHPRHARPYVVCAFCLVDEAWYSDIDHAERSR